MPLILVTYDLKTPGKNYQPLFDAIKAVSSFWSHYLTNTWVIQTNWNVDPLGKHLIQFITTNDRLMAIEVTGIGQGWLPLDAWEWIRKHTD
jgi:hypothetical protein